MKKNDEISNPNSCLSRAGDDEPIFVLRAHDRAAPMAVRWWANQAKARGAPKAKTDEAYAVAQEMEAWQATNGSKVPD